MALPLLLLPLVAASPTCAVMAALNDSTFTTRGMVTRSAIGARAAIAADLDGDGDLDIAGASSEDNTVAWYENLAISGWSSKRQISSSLNGARFVTAADVDGDGDSDVIGASFYDASIRWYENEGTGQWVGERLEGNLQGNVVTIAAHEVQSVAAADLDGDGDLDLVSASSGDSTVAWYTNIGEGRFCEVRHVIDNDARGARSVVVGDFDGDGFVDLAVACKDAHLITWYRNLDGLGTFEPRRIVSNSSLGAYGLHAVDLDADGLVDLVSASNGDDTVSWHRNLGGVGPGGEVAFECHVIFDAADFVLSVYASDFDRDGDLDVASASYVDGAIRWHENLDGLGRSWATHVLYQQASAQAHFVSGGDFDGDGDVDLIAVTKAENSIAIFVASTACDSSLASPSADCCPLETVWNGTRCERCASGTYADGAGAAAQCVSCPSTCTVPGRSQIPPSCAGVTGCNDREASARACDCRGDTYLLEWSAVCVACPAATYKPDGSHRTWADVSGGAAWKSFAQSECVEDDRYLRALLQIIGMATAVMLLLLFSFFWAYVRLVLQYERRVQMRYSGQRPELCLATNHKFHLFLSHTWSTGQDQVQRPPSLPLRRPPRLARPSQQNHLP